LPAGRSGTERSMFGHMFRQQPGLVDLRRRALTLIDVVTERQGNGPLRPQLLLAALAVALACRRCLLPALQGRSTDHWYHEARAGGPWAEVRLVHAVAVTGAYLLAVLAGARAMRRRPPVRRGVFEAMLVYNVAQVVLNASLGTSLWREAWELGFPYPWGNTLDTSTAGHRLGMLLWFQYNCRQLELLDTLFLVLRKRFDRMRFLHVYLRLVHMWGWFFVCRYACGGDSYFPAAVNCMCQVVVYLYYALSLIDERGVPLMRKARVTEAQVLQFAVCAAHACYVLVHGHLPRAVAGLSLWVMMSGLALYVEWDGQQTQLGPRDIELSMFGHMFQQQPSLADLRRRALTLVDVVAERQGNGPLRPHRLLVAVALSLAYWCFALPACRDWGTGRWYREVHASAPSPRAGGPWAEVSWACAAAVTMAYLSLVFVGIRAMERRPPVQKRIFEHMFVYNATQVMLNASLGFSLWREAWRLGFPWPWGNAPSTSPTSHRLGMLLWFQYHCRQLELLDTLFVILRKKFHHMSFLHIFLRLVHMWGWFFACRYACGGDSYFPAAVNCSCQVLVYLYYSLSLIDEQGVPLVRRARVVEVQVLQFVVCATHAFYVLLRGHLPRAVAAWSLFVMSSSLLLYVDFAGEHPRLGPGAEPVREGSGGRLTFRFDSSGWFYVYHFGVALWLEEHLLPRGVNPELAGSERYPKALAFSGSSGGALVAAALACGISVRDLLEFVLAQHPRCQWNPLRMFPAVEEAMERFLPANAARCMSGRVRVLLTRVSARPPFITGEVVEQFAERPDVFHGLRASCHVPLLHLRPYRYHRRHYFDGLVWSSLLVPWSGDDADLVVKVSAISAPLTDMRAPLSPIWWVILPPSVDALRGLFWVGYRDAARWFTDPPQDPLDRCKCRALRSPRRSAHAEEPDPLSRSRFAKHLAAQKLLLQQPRPAGEALPLLDPATGQAVQDLIAQYYRAVDQSFRRALWACAILAAVAAAVLKSLSVSGSS